MSQFWKEGGTPVAMNCPVTWLNQPKPGRFLSQPFDEASRETSAETLGHKKLRPFHGPAIQDHHRMSFRNSESNVTGRLAWSGGRASAARFAERTRPRNRRPGGTTSAAHNKRPAKLASSLGVAVFLVFQACNMDLIFSSFSSGSETTFWLVS